jgi:hypothetical protein
MAAADEPEPVLGPDQRSGLLDELGAHYERVYGEGSSYGCFCGTDGELIDSVNEMRGKASQVEADATGDDR